MAARVCGAMRTGAQRFASSRGPTVVARAARSRVTGLSVRSAGAWRAMSSNVDFGSITPEEFVAHHMDATPEDMKGNGDIGRYFLVPGSAGRAKDIATRFFDDVTSKDGERGHAVHLGKLDGIDVGVVSTGMGCPSVDIIVTELIKLGARRFIRVGSCGSVQPKVIRIGSVAVATGAVKDESTSDCYAPREFPAVADPRMVQALIQGAANAGLADVTYAGVIHSKDSLYTREFLAGFRAPEHRKYMQWLQSLGVIASEMEASMLFTLASTYSGEPVSVGKAAGASQVLAGTVCGVIGDDSPIASPAEAKEAVERAIQVALHGIRELHRQETTA